MRILIVEDERELARTLARAIQEAGMAAEVAFDGERGLQLAREEGFDALVLDLLLPRRHGLDVLREVKVARPGLPVLVLTALSDVDDVVKGLDRGADDYLTKPFALAELLARLRAILRRGRLPSSLVRVADLELDLAARSVRRGGRPIDLTAREFALLQLLVHHPGQVLSRGEIGAHLIDREFEETSNMIDVSICGLRSKLGEPDLIRTVRGAGYSLATEPGA
jgi:two-component system, OmpR family, response regulator